MVLIHYGPPLDRRHTKRSVFTLTLRNGNPVIYTAVWSQSVTTVDTYALDDDEWHHVAVTMPQGNCKLSEVIFFVDGHQVQGTAVSGKDWNIFFATYAQIGIGGFAHGPLDFHNELPNLHPFEGGMDDVYVWGRRIWPHDLLQVMKRRKFKVTQGRKCLSNGFDELYFKASKSKCLKICRESTSCWGYQFKKNGGNKKCTLFDGRPEPSGEADPSFICASVQ